MKAAATVREPDPVAALRAHLCTHMDAEHAEFLLWAIDDLKSTIKPRKKGERQPHWLDDEIDDLRKRIDDNHTVGGKNLGNSYWPTFWREVHLTEFRNRTIARGRPRNEDRDGLILLLAEFYPLNVGRKSRGGRFQKTVGMACTLVGIKATNDMHEVVCNALDGVPVPPDELSIDFQVAWNWWLKVRKLP